MKNLYFRSLEPLKKGHSLAFKDIVDALIFDHKELIPVITQDTETKDVLMMAWMNKAALEKTLSTGRMTYWSRSRKQFWIKGETSGHVQQLQSMRFDCDGDAILCLVKQTGAACHTGRNSCFYLEVDDSNDTVSILVSPP